MDDTEQIERLYSPGEVADYLGIERQTVTKYARLLEQNGYTFHKDEKGNRNYTDSNIMMFKELIKQRNRPGITLEGAAKSIV
ncbi:DNA-binding protein, partial [Peribacillus simplex]|uniref:MerR family transcriptional regulator n=2 Tax=Bacillales TaxID=1385 RepID=UPI000D48BB53